MTKRKAMVAMSGGVDSSVAAALLVEQGYDVTGVMLKLWRGEDVNNNSGCCNLGAAEDARRVADVLGIPFYVFNFAEHFEETVVRNFHDDYVAGRTPNPCVRCNQWIKFGTLLDRAAQLGADVLATGHYARVREREGRFHLLRGIDSRKDQSYVLWMLSQEELAKCRFPVGDMEKTRTREIAASLGLRTAAKPDSQEICFVRDGDVRGYLADRVTSTAGSIVDENDRSLGEHAGIVNFTVGQRKGLGISLGEPVFVTHIDAATNTVRVGSRSALSVVGLTTEETSFTAAPPQPGTRVLVQHRAHGEINSGTLEVLDSDRTRIVYDEPVEAVAPGQSAAFYRADEPDVLLGGGIIDSTFATREALAVA
jgi:tRNA-uridine 2-sulfurtransferase